MCSEQVSTTVSAAADPGRSGAAFRAGRREWVGLAVIALACMLYSMDLTVLNLAVPALARDLKPSASQLLWIIDIYGFMVAGFLIVMGALGDRFGRRRLLLIGAAAFGVASVLAAFAATAAQLIAARALLGVAGATLAPSTLSLITSMFQDRQQRTLAISLWIMSFSIGAIIGPVVGGVLIHYFWWGSVFLAGVPVMLLLLLLGPRLLPEFRNPEAGGIDFTSSWLSLGAVLAIIYAVKSWAEYGVGGLTLLSAGIGIALAAVFIRRQRRLASPLVDLNLFRSPVFSLSLAINLLAIFFVFGIFVFIAQYFQLVAGLSPLQAGLWSLPGALAFAVASPCTSVLAARFSPVAIMTAGIAVSALGCVFLSVVDSLLGVVLASIVLYVGLTPVVALTTGFIVGAAPPAKAGVASAMSETATELGGALGIAALGSLLTVIYAARMHEVVLPAMSLADSGAAKVTLAGAVEAAARLSPAAAETMLVTARAAFVEAFRITNVLAAIALAAMALATGIILAGHRPAEDSHG